MANKYPVGEGAFPIALVHLPSDNEGWTKERREELGRYIIKHFEKENDAVNGCAYNEGSTQLTINEFRGKNY